MGYNKTCHKCKLKGHLDKQCGNSFTRPALNMVIGQVNDEEAVEQEEYMMYDLTLKWLPRIYSDKL